MALHRAPVLPSVLDICPRLRRPTRRAAAEIRRLLDGLVNAFPDAAFLARNPSAADCMDTTHYDHLVADFICAARAISEAIAALDRP